MLHVYGKTQQNLVTSQALYAEPYPDCVHPSWCMCQRVCKKLRNTESLNTRNPKRRVAQCSMFIKLGQK